MHAFALVMKSIISAPWAKQLAVLAQGVVTYFKKSHQPQARLREAIKSMGIKGGSLCAANGTRFTSTYEMLASVLRNEGPLCAVQRQGIVNKAEVAATLLSQEFWRQLNVLCALLQPIASVVMAIQGRHSTLADVTRYWLFLARKMQELVPGIPDGGWGEGGMASGWGA